MGNYSLTDIELIFGYYYTFSEHFDEFVDEFWTNYREV